MDLLTPDLRARLRRQRRRPRPRSDTALPNRTPRRWSSCSIRVGAATWLATELDDDGDALFGLADLGFGCPELGSFSLGEIAALRLRFGLGIERDLSFASPIPLSVWADAARRAGSIAQPRQRSPTPTGGCAPR